MVIHVPGIKTVQYKIAVVLPMSQGGEYQKRLENTVNFALENMRNAQKYVAEVGDSIAVDLDIEWHDEDTEPLEELASELADREDLLLIIGPLRNGNVDIMASACKLTQKPLIVPSASSENIIRRYSVTKSGDKVKLFKSYGGVGHVKTCYKWYGTLATGNW